MDYLLNDQLSTMALEEVLNLYFCVVERQKCFPLATENDILSPDVLFQASWVTNFLMNVLTSQLLSTQRMEKRCGNCLLKNKHLYSFDSSHL